MQVPRRTETSDAPGRQGAASENTGLYLNEPQRRRAGCSARRMQRDLHHGLLGVARAADARLRRPCALRNRQTLRGVSLYGPANQECLA